MQQAYEALLFLTSGKFTRTKAASVLILPIEKVLDAQVAYVIFGTSSFL
jgi:hypothetical protein